MTNEMKIKTNMANGIWIKIGKDEMGNKIRNEKTRENKKGLWLWCERFANLTKLILHVYFRALQKKSFCWERHSTS